MSAVRFFEIAAEIGLAITLTADVLFVAFYSRTRWRGSDVGKNLFWFSVVTATILSIQILRLHYPHHLWLEAIRAFVYLICAPAVFWWRLWLLLKYQKAKSNQEDT